MHGDSIFKTTLGTHFGHTAVVGSLALVTDAVGLGTCKQRPLLAINLRILGEPNLPVPQALDREKWLASNPLIEHMAQGLGGRRGCEPENFGG